MFLSKLEDELNKTVTTNGAVCYKTTGSEELDFFAICGALRNKEDEDIISEFLNVYNVNKLNAMKLLFYTRDIRKGTGERKVFKVILNYLAKNEPSSVIKNIKLISEFGRWDDALVLLGTPCEDKLIDVIQNELYEIDNFDKPSLLFKWLPSCNTSSKSTVAKARVLMKRLNMNEREYRKMLSKGREKLKVTEVLMSANRWEEIEYGKITSKNNLLYKDAFLSHDEDRYIDFVERAVEGEEKVNSKSLFPYEIIGKINSLENKMVDVLWNNLPSYISEDSDKVLVVCDTSGSMEGGYNTNVKPIDVAISLTLLMSEQCVGEFNNKFITFSRKPELVTISGNSLSEKVKFIKKSSWGMDTNLEKVFNLILNTALNNKIPANELPKKLIIVSDMQFNGCVENGSSVFIETMRNRFDRYGYKLPNIVFWNVDERKPSFQCNKNASDILLVSGCSPNIFNNVIKYNSAMDMLNETVLNNPIYNVIEV